MVLWTFSSECKMHLDYIPHQVRNLVESLSLEAFKEPLDMAFSAMV